MVFACSNVGVSGELLLEKGDRSLSGTVVEPAEQAEGEHVLGALGILAGDVDTLQRLDSHRGQRNRVDPIGLQRAVLHRVLGVADPPQVPRGELVGVDDEIGPTREVGQVGLERGRIHGHEDVGGVAGGHDVVVGEVELEG